MAQAYVSKTWTALSEYFSGIVNGNANDEDFGFVETQPGLIDGQGLIFLQKCYTLPNHLQLSHKKFSKQLYHYQQKKCKPIKEK